MAAHRYWRIAITSTQGNVAPALSAVIFGIVQAGSNVATGAGGFATSTAAGSSVAYAFDSSYGTVWTSGSNSFPQYLGYDFGGTPQDIVQVSYVNTDVAAGGLTGGSVQWSDDGVNYTSVVSLPARAYADGYDFRAVDIKDPNAHRYWRIFMPVKQPAAGTITNHAVGELAFRTAVGGPNITGSGTAFAESQGGDTVNPSGAAQAFDANASTAWVATSNQAGQWLAYDFLSPKIIVEIALTAQSAQYAAFTPQTFNIQYSDDNAVYTTAMSVSGQSQFNGGETRVFTLPAYVATTHNTVGATSVQTANTAAIAMPAGTWTVVPGGEGGSMTFSSPTYLRYGANTTWAYKYASGTVTFDNNTFGDPLGGVAKNGWYYAPVTSTVNLTGVLSVQSAVSGTGAITATKSTVGVTSVQANSTGTGVVTVGGNIKNTSGTTTIQGNVASTGFISQVSNTKTLTGTTTVQSNLVPQFAQVFIIGNSVSLVGTTTSQSAGSSTAAVQLVVANAPEPVLPLTFAGWLKSQTATRCVLIEVVAQVGGVETTRYLSNKPYVTSNAANELRYSEDFDSTVWLKNNVSVVANAAAAPDGSMTADVVGNTPNALSYFAQSNSLAPLTTYTLSIFVKRLSVAGVFAMEVDRGDGGFLVAAFDPVLMTTQGAGASIQPASNGFARLVFTFTTMAGSPRFNTFYVGSYGSTSSTTSFAIHGAQLEKSGTVSPYQQTGSTASTFPVNTAYLPVVAGGVQFTEKLALDGTPSLSYGDIELYNVNGERDSWLSDIWRNRSIKVYMGDVSWTRNQFVMIFNGLVFDVDTRTRDRINLKLTDKLQRLNTPVTEHKLGGTSQSKDMLIPLCFGECFNVTPLLTNPALLEYQVHDGAIERIIEVRDNGVPVSFTEFVATGKFRLNQSPVGTITCSVQGDKYLSYITDVGSIIERLVTSFGLATQRFTGADIDGAKLTAFKAANTAPVGIYLNDRTNVLEVCNQLAASVGARVAMSRGGLLYLIKIDLPRSDSGTTVTPVDMKERTLAIAALPDVVASVKLGYAKNWTLESNIQTGIPSDHVAMFAQDWLTVTSTDSATANLYNLFVDPTMEETLLLRSTDATTECNRRLALYKTQRKVIHFEAFPQLLTETLGSTLTVKHPRFGLTSGSAGQIITVQTDWLNPKVTMEVLI